MYDELIDKIIELVGGTSFNDVWIYDLIERLSILGYEATEEDGFAIAFCIQKVDNYIKNVCNTSKIDSGLRNAVIDRVCGEFLLSLKATDKLKNNFDFEEMVKSVQVGDTDVVFGENSVGDEQRLDTLIDYLLNSGKGELECYRKIKW